MECPTPKRQKLETDTDKDASNLGCHEIKSILADGLLTPIQSKSVHIGCISNRKQISKIILELAQLLPIPKLNHLKRVRQNQIILCENEQIIEFLLDRTKCVAETISIFVSAAAKNSEWARNLLSNMKNEKFTSANYHDEDVAHLFDINTELYTIYFINIFNTYDELRQYILKLYLKSCQISETVAESICQNVVVGEVPGEQPQLHWQYELANACWPCKFHRNKCIESLYNNQMFSTAETSFHLRIMELCKYLANALSTQSIGVAVDPRTSAIVAIGIDQTDLHPLMHCPLVLIDMVARSQDGGAWNDWDAMDSTDVANDNNERRPSGYTMHGVKTNVRQIIAENSLFDNLHFGAEEVKQCGVADATNTLTNSPVTLSADQSAADNLIKYGPYLCTGYDVYLLREPCVMCGMALVHSRARKIFFHETTEKGAIHTLTKIHTTKALNHHYEVFRIH